MNQEVKFSFINPLTLLIGVPRSHSLRYILGAKYIAGGFSVPVSKYKEVQKYIKLPPAMLKYCVDMENNYHTAEGIIGGAVKPWGDDFLLHHQKIAHSIATLVPRYAFFMDTGTGKTATALSVMNSDLKENKAPWLVIAPKAILRTAWRDDASKFYPSLKVFVWDKDTKKENLMELSTNWGIKIDNRATKVKLFEILVNNADIIVINPEQFKMNTSVLSDMKKCIIDESTMIKNPSSGITKAVTDFADRCDRLYILTGEPTPNGPEDFFSQIRLIDSSVLGHGITAFKQRYFLPCGFGGYDITPKPGAIEQMTEKIKGVAYFVKKEDCLDLPPKTYLTKEFKLPPVAMQMHREMEIAFATYMDDPGMQIITGSKGAALMKMRQIASGFVIDEEKPYSVHNARLTLLEETLDEIGHKQVIIWAQFRHEITSIEEMLKAKGKTVCTGYGGTKDLEDSINGFKEGRYQYIICHPQSMKFGVTFTNCSYAVYYSYDYNYENYYQSHDRIYRYGQTRPCTFIVLKAVGTIDTLMLNAIKHKKSESQFISELIRGIREKSID